VRILSYAQFPDAPLPSKTIITCFGSAIIGLIMSVIVIWGRKMLHPRVEDPHWTEKHFNLSNLAIIPYSKEQLEATGRLQITKTLPLLAHANPRNLAIESLRSLRTSLQVTLACATNNIISILGVCPGVGKSFVSANLAYLLAAGGKRVLLIDGDLRRGTLHKYFSVESSQGLAEVLSQNLPLEQALRSTMHDNLTLLPRGDYPQDPSELLISERFKSLIELLSQRFDVVVFDTAPILLVTDAVVVSNYSATNYLVLGAGVHRPGEIELVLKRLSSSNVQVHGTIFNFHRMATKMGSYGSKYYYNKYRSYSYYYDDKLKM
jgi:tyrosine-protein kinase Etk/Wzc